MAWLLELRLIRFFGFYLALMFLLSTMVRLRQYGTILGLVRSMPQRWPNLLGLVKRNSHIFLTWGTVLPLALLLLVLAILPEERHLEARFGERYLAYKGRTRRWF